MPRQVSTVLRLGPNQTDTGRAGRLLTPAPRPQPIGLPRGLLRGLFLPRSRSSLPFFRVRGPACSSAFRGRDLSPDLAHPSLEKSALGLVCGQLKSSLVRGRRTLALALSPPEIGTRGVKEVMLAHFG
jgi:hypothetical protein